MILTSDAALMRTVQALEDLAPDSPAVRGAINALSVVVDLFKLSMACMLAVFVPQQCPGNEEDIGGSGNCTTIKGVHDCSFEENFRCLSPLNQFALGWNFVCLILFFFHYALLWKREKFMVYYFEETLQYGRLHLREQMGDDYPTISIWLHRSGFCADEEVGGAVCVGLRGLEAMGVNTVRDADFPLCVLRILPLAVAALLLLLLLVPCLVRVCFSSYNRWLFNISVLVTLFQIVNIIVSGKLCFLDYPSVTSNSRPSRRMSESACSDPDD